MQECMQRYDHMIQQLNHPQETKIKKLIDTGRLERVHADYWICKPTPGYNSTTYNLFRTPYGDFSCTCQGYHKRGSCSHSIALKIQLKAAGESLTQGSLF